MKQPDYITILKKYLKNEATPDEKEVLINWITGLESEHEFEQQSARLWEDAEPDIDAEIETELYNRLQSEIANRQKAHQQHINSMLRLAASILLPLSIGLISFLYLNHHADTEKLFTVSVDCGQKADITLPDGTKVWLNSATTLAYGTNYNETNRRIRLDGEAFFEVAKDKSRPFIVDCEGVEIEALGTSFNVKGYSTDCNVTASLLNGRIRVDNGHMYMILNPGERVEYTKSNNRLIKSGISDFQEITFWRNNILVFDSNSLSDISKTLERMYGINIVFESESLKKLRFSGTIRNTSLQNVLYILSLSHPITYKVENDTVRIDNIK
jgi:ferric-dicitrate binding protein FerR (iron transport regulator)